VNVVSVMMGGDRLRHRAAGHASRVVVACPATRNRPRLRNKVTAIEQRGRCHPHAGRRDNRVYLPSQITGAPARRFHPSLLPRSSLFYIFE
jgi:hypothetical protein